MRQVTNRICETRVYCPKCKKDLAMVDLDRKPDEFHAQLVNLLRKRTKCKHKFEVLL